MIWAYGVVPLCGREPYVELHIRFIMQSQKLCRVYALASGWTETYTL
jgi:hypothetical protein